MESTKEASCFVEDLYIIIKKWNLDKFTGIDARDIFTVMMSSYESLNRIRMIFPDRIEARLLGKDKESFKPDTDSKKPTIEELEKALDDPDFEYKILPSGEIVEKRSSKVPSLEEEETSGIDPYK